MPTGICLAVYPCDRNGTVMPSATDENAVDMEFQINTTVITPPQDQLDLKRDVERMNHALGRLFLNAKPHRLAEFRPYYVQLVRLAQLGLAGPEAAPDIAKRALEGMTAELIDNEGGRVKNNHMRRLAGWALLFAVPFLFAYVFLRFVGPNDVLMAWLRDVNVDPRLLGCFMLLWVGCFLGVVLSYGARTTTMTLSDLTTVDADRLLPQYRLLFAGALTMLVGIFLVLRIIEFRVGESISSSQIADYPMVAFLIGSLCGLTELALPSTVTRKASGLLDLK